MRLRVVENAIAKTVCCRRGLILHMKKHLFYIVLLTVTASMGGAGCSGDKNVAEENGGTGKATDRAVSSAVKKITTPIQHAQDTRHLGDDRLQEMDKALEKM